MVTIKELQRSIEEERKKLKKVRAIETKQIEKSTLQKELFRLRHRKALAARGKGARLLRKAGKGILKASKKAIPILKKQAMLIRQQQLRDDALEKALKKKRIKIKPKRIKIKPIAKKKSGDIGIFKELDF